MGVRQLFDLTGRVALVTGGSRGLGLQMAEALAEMGARIGITARKADELAEASAHLKGLGAEVAVFRNDLSRFESIPGLIDEVLDRFGRLDILVNNAGATWGAPTEEHPDEAWKKVIDLNVSALFYLCREVGKRIMIPRRAGRIINIASIAGLRGGPSRMHTIGYSTSKAAVINFTRALASEWGRYNINVNAICPGFFLTRMSRGVLAAAQDELTGTIPLRRIGGDEDLKGAIVLLASDAGRHITGQYLAVDGGQSAV